MKPSPKAAMVVVFFFALTLGLTWSGGVPSAAAQTIQVTSADPPEGSQGTVNLNVVIKGKGFKTGAMAKFLVTGTNDPGGVKVNSTTFRGSTELLANIDIAETATLSKFDIQVQNRDGRTGKGTELFSVKAKVAACAVPPPVLTAPATCFEIRGGCLDADFGVNGAVITDTTEDPGTDIDHDSDGAYTVAVQSDGKIVVAGQSKGLDSGVAVLRYHTDGSLDTTFGVDGIARVPGFYAAGGRAMVIQPDGRIVLANDVMRVTRLHSDGTLDTTFGSGGIKVISFNTSQAGSGALALQSDGKILVGGWANVRNRMRWAIARLNPDGSNDLTFNNTGTLVLESAADGAIRALLVQTVAGVSGPEERILAGGREWVLRRFTPNGALDTSFGETGTVDTNYCGYWEILTDLVLDASGRIVAGGLAEMSGGTTSNYNFALARYNANGIADTTFGDAGKTTLSVFLNSRDVVWGLAIQPDGRIVVGGESAVVSPSWDPNFDSAVVARFLPSGQLDTSFGFGGVAAFHGDRAFGSRVAIQPWDGKIVHVGWVAANGGYNFLVLRYWPY